MLRYGLKMFDGQEHVVMWATNSIAACAGIGLYLRPISDEEALAILARQCEGKDVLARLDIARAWERMRTMAEKEVSVAVPVKM